MPRTIIIAAGATAEFTVQRSRFIASTAPAAAEADAQAFLLAMRKKYYDARHNCFAWILDDGSRQKSSDDGEPGGTAGVPILSVMQRQSIAAGIIVVTRYFGGIKLGAGGLTRAYSHAAALGLAASSLAERRLLSRIAVSLPYPLLGTLENWARQKEIRTADKRYAEKATLILCFTPEEAAARQAEILDITAGQASLEALGEEEVLLALPAGAAPPVSG